MAATIQAVAPEDIPSLLELIRELARFEKLEHQLAATVESLRESIFGPKAVASALLAREAGELAGYAIYFFTFSSFVGRRGLWLEDVYVRPQLRRRGIGRKLIEAVARVAAEQNCERFEWTALNWNQNALDFYRKLGAQVMDEWVLLRVNAEGILKIAASQGRTDGALR
jgi:GNAT superfamily N-acetyltransferase